MNIEDQLEIDDCTICGGAPVLEEENKGFYVLCWECGSHSVHVAYKSEEDKLTAAQKTVSLWNGGKVIAAGVGE